MTDKIIRDEETLHDLLAALDRLPPQNPQSMMQLLDHIWKNKQRRTRTVRRLRRTA